MYDQSLPVSECALGLAMYKAANIYYTYQTCATIYELHIPGRLRNQPRLIDSSSAA